MIPKLTDEMRHAMSEHPGKPVKVEDDETQRVYVLVDEHEYHRAQALFSDEPLDIRDTYRLQDGVAQQAWSHPDDSAYDDYDSARNQQ